MAIFGSVSTVRAQTAHLTWLQPAFIYIDEISKPETAAHRKLMSLAPGETFRRELIGGIFGLEQTYLTKPRAEATYETHRKYVDVQVVFEGEEFMEVADATGMTVRDAYNPDRDATFYHDVTYGNVLRLRKGEAAVYFPADAHKGNVQVAGPLLVRKVVVKVPVPV